MKTLEEIVEEARRLKVTTDSYTVEGLCLLVAELAHHIAGSRAVVDALCEKPGTKVEDD